MRFKDIPADPSSPRVTLPANLTVISGVSDDRPESPCSWYLEEECNLEPEACSWENTKNTCEPVHVFRVEYDYGELYRQVIAQPGFDDYVLEQLLLGRWPLIQIKVNGVALATVHLGGTAPLKIDPEATTGSKMSGAAVAGIVLGVLVSAGMCCVVVYVLCRRQRQKDRNSSEFGAELTVVADTETNSVEAADAQLAAIATDSPDVIAVQEEQATITKSTCDDVYVADYAFNAKGARGNDVLAQFNDSPTLIPSVSLRIHFLYALPHSKMPTLKTCFRCCRGYLIRTVSHIQHPTPYLSSTSIRPRTSISKSSQQPARHSRFLN